MKRLMTIILTLVTSFTMAQNATPYPKTIQVTGSAEIEIIPDEIYVIVTLQEYEQKKGAGKTDINKIKSEFLANCSSIGLPDTAISIASYEGTNHKAWWLKKKDKEELYANIAYQIKFSSTKKMDELVNKLDDYATQGFEVTRVSHSKLPEFRKQIKIQAIKAAKEKAIYLADAIGEKVGDAVTITENDEGAAIPFNLLNSNSVSYYNWKADGPQKSDSDVDFKKIKMKTGVQAVFALK